MIKILLYFMLASGAEAASEADGWFPVEKVPRAEEVITDTDPSIWVLFSKKLGSENISVRLPDDPVYRTTQDGFILRVVKGSEIFEVTAYEGKVDGGIADSLYELEGKWVHEHIVQTSTHTYKLRTYSASSECPNHDIFISSFSIFS